MMGDTILFVWVCVLTLYVIYLRTCIQVEHNRTSKELCEVYERMQAQLDLTARSERLNKTIRELTRGVGDE